MVVPLVVISAFFSVIPANAGIQSLPEKPGTPTAFYSKAQSCAKAQPWVVVTHAK
jgi:hypothetical protein